jgi:methyl-accepting chemotaxis protein
MAIGKSNLKSSELTDHTLCRLGKWYYSDAASRFKNLPDFISIEEPHKKVHYHGVEAAKCFEARRIDDGLEHYKLLETASVSVIKGLQALLSASAAVDAAA